MTESLFFYELAPAKSPLAINKNVVPFLRNKNLEILRKNGHGEIELFGGKIKYSKIVSYFPEDVPHLLKANYQLFARSVNGMTQIMDYFNFQKSTINSIK